MKQKYYPELPDSIREIYAYNQAATFIVSFTGEILGCNEIALDIFEFGSVEEICKVKAADLTPCDFQDYFPAEISDEHLTNYHYLPRVNQRKNGDIFASEVLTYRLKREYENCIAVYVREIEDYQEFDNSLKERRMFQNVEVLQCELKREKRLRAQMMREKTSDRDIALFDKQLHEAYPKLTSNDLKICKLLIRNYSSSEMANELCVTKEGVFAARKRIRKKLQLEKDMDMVVFLQRKFGEMWRSV
ncbi:MAG: helix-turn-helix transcriptional regulator [Bacteroidales bacterium]|nr:helix-turn-helix transcriptional regulator [Bacteroidales bacterium]